MLFWLLLAIFVVLIIVCVAIYIWQRFKKKRHWASVPDVLQALTIIAGVVLAGALLGLFLCHIDANAVADQYGERYETLVYQYENNVYENENDIGKRELFEDIRKWNEMLAYKKKLQDNYWIGIFYPNIYDQFEFIELE